MKKINAVKKRSKSLPPEERVVHRHEGSFGNVWLNVALERIAELRVSYNGVIHVKEY